MGGVGASILKLKLKFVISLVVTHDVMIGTGLLFTETKLH